MKLVKWCIATLILAGAATAGTIDTLWARRYEGPSTDQYNQSADIYVDPETGEVYVCGSGEKQYVGQTDMLLIKYNAQGETLWTRAVGGNTYSPDDMAQALAVDSAGNVYIAGVTNNASPRGYDITWAKYDSAGNNLWTRKTGWSDEDAAQDIVIGGNGDVYLCGARADSRTGLSAFLVMRVDPAGGDTMWTRSFVLDTFAESKRGKPARDVHPDFYDDYSYWDNCATAMAVTPDGDIVCTGFGLSYLYEREWWTMKLAPTGDTLWTATHRHPNTIEHDDDVAFDLAVSTAGQTYVVGFDYFETSLAYEGYNFAVAYYDPAGNELGARSFNISAEDGDDYAFSVTLDDSAPQNVYVTGVMANPLPIGEQAATYKMSAALTNRWGSTGAEYGGNDDDRGYDIFHRAGRIYIAGLKGNDLLVLGYTTANPGVGQPKNPSWDYVYNSPGNVEDYASAICATDSNHVFFAGQSAHPGPVYGTEQLTARLGYVSRDLGLDSILAPAGIVPYLDTITPQARIVNIGTDPARFTAFMSIGSTYLDTTEAGTPLAPGESVVVDFRDWVAMPVGDIAVRCSVATTGDPNLVNNLKSGVIHVLIAGHDVGCSRIVAPRGAVLLGQAISPTGVIRNYGTVPETFLTVFSIGSSYVDTQPVTLAPGDSVLKSYRTWNASPRGIFAVSCTTILPLDTFTSNDRALDSVQVALIDVGVTAIVSPSGVIDSGRPITPQVIVRNFGDLPEGFRVSFEIPGQYSDIQNVENLGPGDSVPVEFAEWEPRLRGHYYDEARTELPGDMNPENDRLTDSFDVRVVDVGVTAVLAPSGTVDSGASVVPRVSVMNFGSTEQTFSVWFRIHRVVFAAPAARLTTESWSVAFPAASDLSARSSSHALTPDRSDQVYEDSARITLGPGEPGELDFRTWIASPPGSYRLESFTGLSGDANPLNDSAFGSVTVSQQTHDVGVVEIISPQGEVDTGTAVVPTALVTNFGTLRETFQVRFKIDTFYTSDTSMSLDGGASDTVRFETWIASPVGSFETRCSTMLAGDVNSNNDMMLGIVTVLPGSGLSSPTPSNGLPTMYALRGGLPSPFRRQVVVCYALPLESRIVLRVYCTSGALVRTLINAPSPAGYRQTVWDGRDDMARDLPPGTYLCRLEAGSYHSVCRLMKTR